jgi:hypothetical protein
MSQHVASLVIELLPTQWFYAMETHAHQDRWDWLAQAKIQGPFSSSEKATEQLQRDFPQYEGTPTVRPYDAHATQDSDIAALVRRVRQA